MSPASRSCNRARVMNKQSMCVVYSSAKQLVRCGIRNQVSTQYGIPVTLGRYASCPRLEGSQTKVAWDFSRLS